MPERAEQKFGIDLRHLEIHYKHNLHKLAAVLIPCSSWGLMEVDMLEEF